MGDVLDESGKYVMHLDGFVGSSLQHWTITHKLLEVATLYLLIVSFFQLGIMLRIFFERFYILSVTAIPLDFSVCKQSLFTNNRTQTKVQSVI